MIQPTLSGERIVICTSDCGFAWYQWHGADGLDLRAGFTLYVSNGDSQDEVDVIVPARDFYTDAGIEAADAFVRHHAHEVNLAHMCDFRFGDGWNRRNPLTILRPWLRR